MVQRRVLILSALCTDLPFGYDTGKATNALKDQQSLFLLIDLLDLMAFELSNDFFHCKFKCREVWPDKQSEHHGTLDNPERQYLDPLKPSSSNGLSGRRDVRAKLTGARSRTVKALLFTRKL
ncbi:hypothetical protein CEXT_329381 [Caerostris extrusa]|uniref:Uncharacterized protein n=1 Tax=Caerostris extrusa TaxID=172846 RepID=A0AAV4R4B8_CAEEX|nr:hypothetical protein CEXT_329381 [Caerostris extrusa]